MQGCASRMEVVLLAQTHGCDFSMSLSSCSWYGSPSVTSLGQPWVVFGVSLKGVGLFNGGVLLLVCVLGFLFNILLSEHCFSYQKNADAWNLRASS